MRPILSLFLLFFLFDLSAQSITCNPDTTRIAILPFKKYYVSDFDASFREASLIGNEYCLLQRILVSYFNDEKLMQYKMGYGEYRYQCVPVMDSTGKKLVVVNGFCIRSGKLNTIWKEEILRVRDGGPCYFIGLIDLAEKKVKDLIFNAE